MFGILVVCTANVCRSPIGTAALRQRLAGPVAAGLVSVESAGVRADDGEPVCPAAVTIAGVPDLRHTSRLLTAEQASAASLVLTADLEQRGAVVRLAPSARSKTFTLVEAAVLARWLLEGSPLPEGVEISIGPAMPETLPERLPWWVGELNEGRGLPALGRQQEWEIRDAHGPDGADHADTVAQVIAACAEIGDAIVALLSDRGRTPGVDDAG